MQNYQLCINAAAASGVRLPDGILPFHLMKGVPSYVVDFVWNVVEHAFMKCVVEERNGDPRAAERTWQLLNQVIGRAGREAEREEGAHANAQYPRLKGSLFAL